MSKAKQLAWNHIKASPVILVSGQEEFLASRSIRNLREQLRSDAPDLEVIEIDASEYGPGAIYNYASPSLFNEPRLLIIRNVERCTDELIEDGIAYLANPTDETYVVFRHNGSSVRGKKLLEAIRASSVAIEVLCEPIKAQDRAAFVAAEFAAANKQISNGAVRALCDAFASDLAELAAACQQLIQDASDNIDEKLVEKYYSGRVETTAYKVVDAALAGQSSNALQLLRHAISSGADPVPLVIAFASQVRQISKVFENRSVTAAQVGCPPWALDKARRESNGWTEEGLAKVINEIAVCDAAAKGAERDSVYALERLVLLIAAKGKAR